MIRSMIGSRAQQSERERWVGMDVLGLESRRRKNGTVESDRMLWSQIRRMDMSGNQAALRP